MSMNRYSQSTALMNRAAVMYYHEQKSQQMIAKELGISNATVSRLLNSAKDNSLIRFVLDEELFRVMELENAIKDKYSLEDVLIARVIDKKERENSDKVRDLVGFEAAKYIQRTIKDDDILGITFGRTIHRMIENLYPSQKKDTQFITLQGDYREYDSDISSVSLVSEMAKSFGGTNHCITYPAHYETEEEAERIKDSEEMRNFFEMFKKVNTAVTSVGSFYPDQISALMRCSFFDDEFLEELRDKNVYADIVLSFLDEKGNEVKTSLNEKTLHISLDDFRKIPEKIILASGAEKAYSLRSVLRAGLSDVLILDYDLAEKLNEIS